MSPVLHPNTVRALVDYICDIGGPFERPTWRIPEFFRSAGWRGVPEYDGPTRPQWVAQRLRERLDDRVAVEQVLRQLCDQREYESVQDAAHVQNSLNEVLAREGLRVDYQDGRPVVVDIVPPHGASARAVPVELSVDLDRIIADRRMVEILRARYAEAAICRDNNAHVAAIVILGSLVEGALLAVLAERDPAIRAQAQKGRPAQGYSLSALIDMAHKRGYIARDAKDFAHVMRQYRNFVHPRAQLAFDGPCDADTVAACWHAGIMALNDLGSIPPSRQPETKEDTSRLRRSNGLL